MDSLATIELLPTLESEESENDGQRDRLTSGSSHPPFHYQLEIQEPRFNESHGYSEPTVLLQLR